MAPETGWVNRNVDKLTGPSMRPGQDGPGNFPCPLLGGLDPEPSMRPGQDGPGNGASPSQAARGPRLQ